MTNHSSTLNECVGGMLPAYEAPGLVLIMILFLLTTVVTFLIHIKTFFDRVDFSHPVFAVILQDMFVMYLCGLVNLLMVVYVAFTHSESVFVSSLSVGRVAINFHPVAWLVVTSQRYYLLVLKQDTDVDMNSLRRKSLTFVWVIFLLFLVLTQGIIILSLTMHGWPHVPIKDYGNNTGFIIVTTAIILSNLPDLFSVVIFVALWKHLKNPIRCQEEAPYGGIWLGENEVELPPIEGVVHINQDSKHKSESVLKALQWHLKLCMADMAFPILAYFGCNKIIIYFMYPMQIICFYWVPLLVIKKGFKELDGVVQHVTRMILCRIVSNNVVPYVQD